MPRAYAKKSDYWERRKTPAILPTLITPPTHPELGEDQMGFDNSPHFTALAALGGGNAAPAADSYKDNWAPTIQETYRYRNIRGGIMPYMQGQGGYYSVGDAISLATLSYFNVSIVRNTLNLLQDFSISPLHIKTSNKTVKSFFTKWFETIGLNNFMAQFFLEYYRSGNVFIYKFNGRIDDDKFAAMKTAFSGAKSPQLPIRYIILNPMQVYLQVGPAFNYTYSKMLSTYELQRLRDPQTPEDIQVLKSFPPEIQKQIKTYAAQPYVYVPLDTERLYYCFYRKQDYEPLAIPMIFPVLNDIEYKLELKKMDMSLARQMEQAFLLVTNGGPKTKEDAGTDPRVLANLNRIFQNQTIGRVLVADYSTKATWTNPDLKDLLGSDKYAQVDKDIHEGLQYMFFGNEKFANSTVKARIFAESLREGRRILLDNFLRPEVKKVCEALGFKNVPTLEFEDIDLSDQAAMQRLIVQMAQLGLLDDQQTFTALKTGVFPDKDDAAEAQKEYAANREKGYYLPLIGASMQDPAPGGGGGGGGMGRPPGKGPAMPNRKPGKIGVSKSHLSQTQIVQNVKAMEELQANVEKALCKKHKLKVLSEAQAKVAYVTAKSIAVNEKPDQWKEAIGTYITEFKEIPAEVGAELDEIGIKYDVDPWLAIVLWRSQIEEPAQSGV